MRLLLIEDNERFVALLKRGLTTAGFLVDILATADDAAAAALRTNRFEIVILDLGLSDADRLELLGEMRRGGDATPVLTLTARGGLEDRVTGLGGGADDYLVKPFALEELVARLRALLRRPGNLLGLTLNLGNLSLDAAARQAFIGGQPIFLSPRIVEMHGATISIGDRPDGGDVFSLRFSAVLAAKPGTAKPQQAAA